MKIQVAFAIFVYAVSTIPDCYAKSKSTSCLPDIVYEHLRKPCFGRKMVGCKLLNKPRIIPRLVNAGYVLSFFVQDLLESFENRFTLPSIVHPENPFSENGKPLKGNQLLLWINRHLGLFYARLQIMKDREAHFHHQLITKDVYINEIRHMQTVLLHTMCRVQSDLVHDGIKLSQTTDFISDVECPDKRIIEHSKNIVKQLVHMKRFFEALKKLK